MGQRLDEFRANAADCVEAARRTDDTNAAAALLLMAEKWIKLADEKSRADADLERQLVDFNRRQLLDKSDL